MVIIVNRLLEPTWLFLVVFSHWFHVHCGGYASPISQTSTVMHQPKILSSCHHDNRRSCHAHRKSIFGKIMRQGTDRREVAHVLFNSDVYRSSPEPMRIGQRDREHRDFTDQYTPFTVFLIYVLTPTYIQMPSIRACSKLKSRRRRWVEYVPRCCGIW